MHTFGSDNFSTVDPRVMEYLTEINQGHVQSYEGDPITRQAEAAFEREFGAGTQVIFVPSGTGANVLGIKLLTTRPYEAVMTSELSHLFAEETGAVAANLGVHIFTLPQHDGKIDLKELQQEVELRRGEGFHSPLPKIVSIANSTEYGTCYSVDEVRALADYCHSQDLYLHMDGCRLPNAAAALGVTLREITRDAGVDVLSFGGAKNGLMSAEAVVVFNAPPSDLLRMQKQSMQLVSKLRYVSGQFVPYLADERWRKNAATANRLAQQVAEGLARTFGKDVITRPVETNQVFCQLPPKVLERIRAAGHTVYDWTTPGEVRLVTSWDMSDSDLEQFFSLIKG